MKKAVTAIQIGILIICANVNFLIAQTADLTSVDKFFKVIAILKEGKEVSVEQWNEFDNSSGYKELRQNSMNIIKSMIHVAFGKENFAEKDSILSITQDEMDKNPTMLIKKLTLVNYLDINDNYESLKSFRANYNFNALVEKAIQRLYSFLEKTLDSTFEFKPVNFFLISLDGLVGENGICIDFNLIYKKN